MVWVHPYLLVVKGSVELCRGSLLVRRVDVSEFPGVSAQETDIRSHNDLFAHHRSLKIL